MTTPTQSKARTRFKVNIEGTVHPWPEDRICTDEVRRLGELPDHLDVLLIDLRSNEQRSLRDDECVELRPGMGFARKFQFKRAR